MTVDIPLLTLLGTLIITPAVGAIGYVIKRKWDDRAAEIKRYLDKIDALQERIFSMQQEQIKAETLRAAATGDTNQILKTLSGAVDALSKAKGAP